VGIQAGREDNSECVRYRGDAEQVASFFLGGEVAVLTGAGCSTESGIPDYRDGAGAWKRPQPVRFHDFTHNQDTRRRYWARSFAGWPQMATAAPNPAHDALAELERSGHVSAVITQNVDGLHQRAGSRHVIDLHGRIDRVICLDCGSGIPRRELQERIAELNPGWERQVSRLAPDGDADLREDNLAGFRVPGCPLCGGMLKPDVVFFGENVPRTRVEEAFARVREARALLVVGSSLMVWSGLRFVKAAAELGLPVAAVNRGRTRADELLGFKVQASCGEILSAAVCLLESPSLRPERP
jgi:NAD-dependent SIR2 family protein deacetylase